MITVYKYPVLDCFSVAFHATDDTVITFVVVLTGLGSINTVVSLVMLVVLVVPCEENTFEKLKV